MKENNFDDKSLKDIDIIDKNNELTQETKLEKDNTDIEYFSISLKRLAILSVLTLGIYEIYWFYKNWKAIQKVEKQDISPFWRAWFAIFYCHGLFKKILQSAKRHGYNGSYSSGLIATVYIVLLLVGNSLSRAENFGFGFYILSFLIGSSTFIPLLFVQKAINFNNSKVVQNYNVGKKFLKGEIISITLGIIYFGLILSLTAFNVFNSITFKDESSKQTIIEECLKSGNELVSREYCECAYNYITNNYGDKELIAMTGKSLIGNPIGMDNAFNNAYEACKSKIYNPSISTEDWIGQVVQEAKSSITLPYKIDENTTMIDITAEPTAIRYHFIVSGINSSSLTNVSLKNYFLPGICTNNDLEIFFDQGINLEYSYIDKNINKTFFFSVTKNDCLTQ